MHALLLVLLSNDHKTGFNFGCQLFRILNDDSRVDVGAYSDSLRMILFPTVFDGPEWVTYVKIDDTPFFKKIAFYKSNKDKDVNEQTASNQKTNPNYTKIPRNEAIALEFGQKHIHSKKIEAQLMATLPMVRSVTSILAIES
jgi:hypothetical protein